MPAPLSNSPTTVANAGFAVTASTDVCPVASMECAERRLYATQFHPEVRHTPHGYTLMVGVILNFLFGIFATRLMTMSLSKIGRAHV